MKRNAAEYSNMEREGEHLQIHIYYITIVKHHQEYLIEFEF